jgi:hypothetical protein
MATLPQCEEPLMLPMSRPNRQKRCLLRLGSQKPLDLRKFCENGWLEIMLFMMCVLVCMSYQARQKKRVSYDKNAPQTIWRYKRGVAQTVVVTNGFECNFEHKNILETGSGELLLCSGTNYRGFRLSPRCGWGFRSSGLLYTLGLLGP